MSCLSPTSRRIFEPFLAQALEAVRAGARLERAAAQDVGPRRLDLAGDLVEDRRRSRPRTARRSSPGRRRRSCSPAAPSTTDVLRVELAAGQLERLQDRQHLLDAGNGGQRLGLQLVLVADDADDGALLAPAEVRLEAELRDALEDVIDLLAGWNSAGER